MTKGEAIKAAIERAGGNMDSPEVRAVCANCIRGLDARGIARIAAKAMALKAEYDAFQLFASELVQRPMGRPL